MCPTETQVDIKPFADGKSNVRGIMLVITRWQLLGDGSSPFDNDVIRGPGMKAGRWLILRMPLRTVLELNGTPFSMPVRGGG